MGVPVMQSCLYSATVADAEDAEDEKGDEEKDANDRSGDCTTGELSKNGRLRSISVLVHQSK